MTATSLFAQHLAGTTLRDCFDFWLSRRQGQRSPQKRTINATQIPRAILPNLFLYELTAENRFKCRLAGFAIRQAFGKEPTGLFLDELVSSERVRHRIQLFRATLEEEMPVVYGGNLAEGENQWMWFKRLLLPVTDDRQRSRFIFGMVIFPRPDFTNANELSFEFEARATDADLEPGSGRTEWAPEVENRL